MIFIFFNSQKAVYFFLS